MVLTINKSNNFLVFSNKEKAENFLKVNNKLFQLEVNNLHFQKVISIIEKSVKLKHYNIKKIKEFFNNN